MDYIFYWEKYILCSSKWYLTKCLNSHCSFPLVHLYLNLSLYLQKYYHLFLLLILSIFTGQINYVAYDETFFYFLGRNYLNFSGEERKRGEVAYIYWMLLCDRNCTKWAIYTISYICVTSLSPISDQELTV